MSEAQVQHIGMGGSNNANMARFEHKKTAEKMHSAKKRHRTEITPADWSRCRYAQSNVLERLSHITYDEQTIAIPRIRRQDHTVEEFFEKLALTNTPVIIEGMMEDWPALKDGEQSWSLENLEKRLRHVILKVGEDDDGRRIRIKMKYFMDYLKNQVDDSPLYLFESNLDDNQHIVSLRNDYKIPEYFPSDFFNLAGNENKPPFRWFCIGPKRSGTTVHKDPLATHAWNAVTSGRKRWLVAEPQIPRATIKGRSLIRKGEDDEAVHYFDFILPRIKAANPTLKIWEGIQGPGETIFVPYDHWHAVVNLEDTVAITQNYCGYDNFDAVWCKTRKDRKRFAVRWLRAIKRHKPDLYERVLYLNDRDGYVMFNERTGKQAVSSSDSSSSSSSDGSSSDEDDIDFDGVFLPKNCKIVAPWKMADSKNAKTTNGYPHNTKVTDVDMRPTKVGKTDARDFGSHFADAQREKTGELPTSPTITVRS